MSDPEPSPDFQRARFAQRSGLLDEAFKICQIGLKKAPDDVTLLNLYGVLFFERKEHEAAYQAWSRVLLLNPEWSAPLSNIGNVLTHMGRINEAAKFTLKAVSMKPKSALLRNNLSQIYSQFGESGKALREIEAAYALDPKNAEVEHMLSMTLLLHGDYVKGWKHSGLPDSAPAFPSRFRRRRRHRNGKARTWEIAPS